MALELNGTTGVSAVQAGAVESGDLPAGSVIQVVQGTANTATSTTSSGFLDIGLSASITPISTDSKILIFFSLLVQFGNTSGGGTDGRLKFQLLRDSTEISTNPSGDKTTRIIAGSSLGEALYSGYQSHNFLDSPSTTSSITYQLKSSLVSGNFARYHEENNTSTITLMEIAG